MSEEPFADDASWASEAPSLASLAEEDLPEPEAELEGLDVDSYDEGDHEQGADPSIEWTAEVSTNVKLHYDDVDDELLVKMKQQIAYINRKIEGAKRNYQEDDLQRMSDYTQIYNCFAQAAFYQKMQAIANKNRPDDGGTGNEAVTMREIELIL